MMATLEKQSIPYSSRQTAFNVRLRDLLLEMRPHQWVKNIFLAAGLIFTGNFTNLHMLSVVLLAICVFCMLSASAYIVNDIIDLENDRNHPRKSSRPLASGRMNPATAYTAAAMLVVFAGILTLVFSLGLHFALAAACYYLLTVLYSVALKKVLFVDVLAIAGGFVLRVIAGCVVIGPGISPWIVICSLLLALFLALCKRRHELLLLGDGSAAVHRAVLGMYSIEMLDQLISVTMSTVIMAYSLYTFYAGHSPMLMLTIPSVIYGLFRYLYLMHNEDIGGTPEQMFRDKSMIINFAIWSTLSIVIMQLNGG
ncbi:MAG: UbiA prenyltransferase family protein [bacterium]|nr:UbiA prenyltransferase family protein [bacterium]